MAGENPTISEKTLPLEFLQAAVDLPEGDKIVVVAGADGGIGFETTLALVDLGFKVIAVDLEFKRVPCNLGEYEVNWSNPNAVKGYPHSSGVEKWIRRVIGNEGPDTIRVKLDITADVQVLNLFDALTFLRIPVVGLVNAAGISLVEWSDEIKPGDFMRVLDVNLLGPFIMSSVYVNRFKGMGMGVYRKRVVNIGSLAANQFFRGGAAYVSSKAGLKALTRVMSKEHSTKGEWKFLCVQPETLNGDSKIADYVRKRLIETRGKANSFVYNVTPIEDLNQADKYFLGDPSNPQSVRDIAVLVTMGVIGLFDHLNGSSLDCLDGRS